MANEKAKSIRDKGGKKMIIQGMIDLLEGCSSSCAIILQKDYENLNSFVQVPAE